MRWQLSDHHYHKLSFKGEATVTEHRCGFRRFSFSRPSLDYGRRRRGRTPKKRGKDKSAFAPTSGVCRDEAVGEPFLLDVEALSSSFPSRLRGQWEMMKTLLFSFAFCQKANNCIGMYLGLIDWASVPCSCQRFRGGFLSPSFFCFCCQYSVLHKMYFFSRWSIFQFVR